MTSFKRILEARQRALNFLWKSQYYDGAWRDFMLPVGSSDSWISAFTALQILRSDPVMGQKILDKALNFLENSTQNGRWGFNHGSGSDADSTAWVALLVAENGGAGPDVDIDWLVSHKRPGGGFATYLSDDCWGQAHVCVTPVVLLALPQQKRLTLCDTTVRWLRANREEGNAWSGYWWRGAFYPSLMALVTLVATGHATQEELNLWQVAPQLSTAHSAFDLACYLRLVRVSGGSPEALRILAEKLVDLQEKDGRWPSSEVLRVSRHWVAHPGNEDGAIFADTEGILTAAMAVRALTEAVL